MGQTPPPAPFVKSEQFDRQTKDATGKTAHDYIHLIGSIWTHSGNLHDYCVMDIVWIGDTDLWGIAAYRAGSPITCVRSIDDFFGKRSGTDRFSRKSDRFVNTKLGEPYIPKDKSE